MGPRRPTITRLCRACFPARAKLGEDRVDGVDELVDVVLGHRRRQRTHPARRHEDAVVHEPEKEVTRALLVRAGDTSVVDHGPLGEMEREHGAGRIDLHRDVV